MPTSNCNTWIAVFSLSGRLNTSMANTWFGNHANTCSEKGRTFYTMHSSWKHYKLHSKCRVRSGFKKLYSLYICRAWSGFHKKSIVKRFWLLTTIRERETLSARHCLATTERTCVSSHSRTARIASVFTQVTFFKSSLHSDSNVQRYLCPLK